MKKVVQKLGLGKDKEIPSNPSSNNTSPNVESKQQAADSSKMSSVPKTMKAAVLTGQNKPLEIKEVAVPEAQPGEILIKVHACGVCHSDAHVQHGDMGPP